MYIFAVDKSHLAKGRAIFLSMQSFGIGATPPNANGSEPHPQGSAVGEAEATDFNSFGWFGTARSPQAQTADMFPMVKNYSEVFER